MHALNRVLTLSSICTALAATVGCTRQHPTTAASPPASGPAVASPPFDTEVPSSFGDGAWLDRKHAAERNVSVAPGNSYARVVYQSSVRVVDEGLVRASLQGFSSDGHGAVFQDAPPAIRDLRAGDILLIKGAAAAKILAAQTDAGQTVLVIDEPRLNEVVQSGEISLEPSVSFHGPQASASRGEFRPVPSWMDAFVSAAYAQDPGPYTYATPPKSVTENLGKSVKDALVDGWKITRWSVVPAQSSAVLATTLTKNTNGFRAVVSMDGTISDFQWISKLKIPTPQNQISSGLNHMSGHLHFVWEIGKDSPGPWTTEDRLKLPAALTIALGPMLEGLPLELEISSAFLIHPAITGGNEYSKGGFDIDWVGKYSQVAQNTSDPVDDSDGPGLRFAVTDDANVSPIAPNGMVISIAAPRIELKVCALGKYEGLATVKAAAHAFDAIVASVASKLLSSSAYAALAKSPIGQMTVSNALASSADVYAQVIHTQGVTHSANITAAPCTKIELKVTGQVGGDVQLFNLTNAASKTKDVFTKTFKEWRPPSSFCKSV